MSKRGICLTFRSGPWSDTGEEGTASVSLESLDHLELEIYNFIKGGKFTTADETANILEISLRKVERTTSKLKTKGLIYRGGNNRSGKWETTT